jgi:hypothetical protein
MTIIDHAHNKYKTSNIGRPSALGQARETLLAASLESLASWGWGLEKNKIMQIASDWMGQKLGRRWFEGFMKRNPALAQRKASSLQANRAQTISKECVDEFYQLVQKKMDDLNLHYKPHNIYNLDEAAFTGIRNNKKIVVKKGTKNPVNLCGNTEKTSYTVLNCCNAAGGYVPPYVVYKSEEIYPEWTLDGPPNARYNCSPSGWMEFTQFQDWFEFSFIPYIKKTPGPYLLYMDGHNSHISVAVVDLAIANDVSIICIPPHSSHCLQPLDKGRKFKLKKFNFF